MDIYIYLFIYIYIHIIISRNYISWLHLLQNNFFFLFPGDHVPPSIRIISKYDPKSTFLFGVMLNLII